MTEADPTRAAARDAYVRSVENANRRWKSTAEAIDAQFMSRLEREGSDQSPAALHSQYMRQRDRDRRAWQSDLSGAADAYKARTGEKKLPAVGWTPMPPDPLPSPRPTGGKAKAGIRTRWLPWAAVGLIVLLAGTVFSAINKSSSETRAAGAAIAAAQNSTVEVLYEVEGTAKSADLTLESGTGTIQANDKAVPLGTKSTGKRGISATMNRGHFVYISAQNQGSSGTITCRITVNGIVISTNTSTGGYAIASCKGTA